MCMIHNFELWVIQMNKKYIVRLTSDERQTLEFVIDKLKGTAQKVRRAYILLKADADGPSWKDSKIAEAYRCRITTVENIRRRFVERGFELTLSGKKRDKPPRKKLLSGRQEAQVIALRLGKAPEGYSNWSLRLLSKRVVELGIVQTISHETIRKTLKKMV